MSFKTLLVHVESDRPNDGSPARDQPLGAAVDLAFDLSATLVGVGVGGPFSAAMSQAFVADMDGAFIQAAVEGERQARAAAEARFRRLAARLGQAAEWRTGEDQVERALEGCAAGADLVLVGGAGGAPSGAPSVGGLALRLGLPVLVIPRHLPALRRRTIVVAWTNGREARRAVTDALPFLLDAEEVVVAEVVAGDASSDPWNGLVHVVERLKRHGVAAVTQPVPAQGADDGADDLIAFARHRGADMIVAGAYGHSRLREWSFGGFTRALLGQGEFPVLLSH